MNFTYCHRFPFYARVLSRRKNRKKRWGKSWGIHLAKDRPKNHFPKEELQKELGKIPRPQKEKVFAVGGLSQVYRKVCEKLLP